jgi:flagellar biosynthesis protein FlhA
MLGGVALGSGRIRAGRHLAVDTGEVIGSMAVPGEQTVDPSFGCPALWIDASARDSAIAEGYMVVDAESVIATHINQLIARQAQALLGPDQVRDLLDYLRQNHAQLIDTITPNPLPLAAVTRLFKALLADGISLRHSLRILASLSQACQQTNDHDQMIDLIRADLGGMLVGDICAPAERLPVLTLAAQLEAMVVGGLHDPATGTIVIDPDLARSIGEHVGAVMQSLGPGVGRAALIVQPRARRPLASLLAARVPGCTVLSINELPSSQPIEVVAVIGEDEAAPALIAQDKDRLAA